MRLRYRAGPNSEIRFLNFWNLDLAPFDVVYGFLSPAPMTRLYDKAKAEMKPGSLFISNSFTVPSRAADQIVELDDRRRTRLHIWRM